MKRCPECRRTYADESLNFCRVDGTPLVAAAASDESGPTRFMPAPPERTLK